MYHLCRGLAAGLDVASVMGGLSYWPIARMKREAKVRPASTTKKKIEAITTMMKTITEVIQVSLRLGHTILRPSARTWLANCGMDVRSLGPRRPVPPPG